MHAHILTDGEWAWTEWWGVRGGKDTAAMQAIAV